MIKNLSIHISRKHLLIFLSLIIIVSISQFIMAKNILKMGFFTDDWLFLSAYRASVINPFSDFMQAWKEIGSHNFSYVYYIGVLYSFFGLDYSAYRIINQIFKIFATLSLYPLVLYISKRRLLAFLTTFIFGIHFSSFGLLDGPSRGGNFIAITLMNLFLLAYFCTVQKKVSNIFASLGLSIWLLVIILLGSTRLFPLVVILPFLEIFNYIWTRKGFKISLKRLAVIYTPFLLLFLFSPTSISSQIGYIRGLFEMLKVGNWQLFLTSFAAMGSMFIPRDFWPFFGHPLYANLNSYIPSLLLESLLVYFILLIAIVFFISTKPLKFLVRNLSLNFVIGIIVYLIAHNWLFLDPKLRTPVDPGTFIIPALIGLYTMATSFCVFWEWKESKKKNNLLPYLFFVLAFSLAFIFLTWLFADINSIFTGVHAYLTIPSIGISIVLATILVLIYERLKFLHPAFKASLIIIILFIYFQFNSAIVDKFFYNWMDNGLRIIDQKRILNQFWTEISDSKNFNIDNLPLVYLDTAKTKYEDGAFYSEVIVWRLASMFDLKYKKNKEGRFSLCMLEILGKEKLDKYITAGDDGKTIISTLCGEKMVYKTENFYAFSLIDRNLVPERLEILRNLGIE